MLCYFCDIHWGQGRTEGGVGVKPPLSFLFCKKTSWLCMWDHLFSHTFACYFVDLMEIPRNKFACKFQGTLWMGQRVIILFWRESGLSSLSRNHLTNFCWSFVYYARDCVPPWFTLSETVVFILSAKADQRKCLPHWLITNLYSTIELLYELTNSGF